MIIDMIVDIFSAVAASAWAIFNGIGFGVIGTIEIIDHITQMLQGIM